MELEIEFNSIQIPSLFVTPTSYKLSKEHTISAIESLVLTSTEFKSLMKYAGIERIHRDHLRGVIKSIINEMVVTMNESVSRFKISRQVIIHYMTDIGELAKLKDFDRLMKEMGGAVLK